jgi:hypothetical protein
LIASFLFGATTWFVSAAITFSYFGWFGLIIGLVFAGIGVFPMALWALFVGIDGGAQLAWALIVMAIITFGTRVFAYAGFQRAGT